MTEQDIIRGCTQKNNHCQHLLFNQYAGILMSICLRYSSNRAEAEDMLQEAFINIFNNIQQYRYHGSFEGWLKKITVNACLAELQKKRLISYTPDEIENSIHIHSSSVISELSEKELIQIISRLPHGYRIIFNLFAIEGYSHDEIAALLNIETVTSRSQLAKARKLLQKQITSEEKFISRHDR